MNPDPNISGSRSLVPFFILVFISGGIARPFMNIYLLQAGMDIGQIGIVQGGTSMLIILVAPLVGWYTDHYNVHRRVLNGAVFLKGISMVLLTFSTSFWVLTSLVSVREVSARIHDTIMNHLAFEKKRSTGGRGLGSTRMWGAVAFMLSSYLAGILTRFITLNAIFIIAGLCSFCACFFIRSFPGKLAPLTTSDQKIGIHIFGFLDPSLTMMILFFAMACQGSSVFFFVYASTSLGLSNEWIGLLGSVGALGEVASLFVADRLLQRHGAVKMLTLAFGLSIVGWIGMALAKDGVLIIPFYLLKHGASSGLFLVPLMAMLTHGRGNTRPATQQMLARVTLPGMAAILAQPVGGFMLQHFGGTTLFLSYAMLACVAALVLRLTPSKVGYPYRQSGGHAAVGRDADHD